MAKQTVLRALPAGNNIRLIIYNSNGEKIQETNLTDAETQLDISALPRGVYFVRMYDERVVVVEKFVKE